MPSDPDSGCLTTVTGNPTTATENPTRGTGNRTTATESLTREAAMPRPTTVAVSLSPVGETPTAADWSRSWAAAVAASWAATG